MQHFETLDEGHFYHIYNHAVGGLSLFQNEGDYCHFLYLYEKYIQPIADTYAWVLMPNHFHILVRMREDLVYRYCAHGEVLKEDGKYWQPYVDLSSTSSSTTTSSTTSDSSCEPVRRSEAIERVETDRWKEMKWETMRIPNLSSRKALDSVGYSEGEESGRKALDAAGCKKSEEISSEASNNITGDKEDIIYRKPKPEKHISHLCSSYSLYYNRKHDKWGTLFQRPFKRKRIDNEAYLRTVLIYIHNNPVHHGFCDHPLEYPWSSFLSCTSDGITKLRRKEVLSWFGDKSSFLEQHKEKDNEGEGDLEEWLEM